MRMTHRIRAPDGGVWELENWEYYGKRGKTMEKLFNWIDRKSVV